MKRLMVALDFSSMDAKLITYTGFIADFLKPQKIYFVNVQEDLDIPEKMFLEHQLPSSSIDEKLADQMRYEVERYFPDYENYEIDYMIKEGPIQKEILRSVYIKEIDLLIVGKKTGEDGSGLGARQLARKVMSSVLFVPENARLRLNQVIIPTDFSKFSLTALEMGITLTKENEDAEVFLQHIFHVPTGYYRTGKTEREFADIMEQHAEEACEDFLKDLNQPATLKKVFSYDSRMRSPAYMIYDRAKAHEVDLIIMGARGRNAITALFLGSVTERLLHLQENIPILVAKDPTQKFGFSEMIDAVAMT